MDKKTERERQRRGQRHREAGATNASFNQHAKLSHNILALHNRSSATLARPLKSEKADDTSPGQREQWRLRRQNNEALPTGRWDNFQQTRGRLHSMLSYYYYYASVVIVFAKKGVHNSVKYFHPSKVRNGGAKFFLFYHPPKFRVLVKRFSRKFFVFVKEIALTILFTFQTLKRSYFYQQTIFVSGFFWNICDIILILNDFSRHPYFEA